MRLLLSKYEGRKGSRYRLFLKMMQRKKKNLQLSQARPTAFRSEDAQTVSEKALTCAGFAFSESINAGLTLNWTGVAVIVLIFDYLIRIAGKLSTLQGLIQCQILEAKLFSTYRLGFDPVGSCGRGLEGFWRSWLQEGTRHWIICRVSIYNIYRSINGNPDCRGRP